LPQYQEISDIVDGIIRSGVNFIALDFDRTLIDVHTHGQWLESYDHLLSHVRPFFKTFLILALRRGHLLVPLYPSFISVSSLLGLLAAMVTFSPQTELVSDVLHACLPRDLASKVDLTLSPQLIKTTDPNSRPRWSLGLYRAGL
jgi:hypothetical protein